MLAQNKDPIKAKDFVWRFKPVLFLSLGSALIDILRTFCYSTPLTTDIYLFILDLIIMRAIVETT